MNRPLRVALLTTDNREHYKDYANPQPHFGTAPEALLQGFAQCRDVEVEVVSCVRKPVTTPVQLAPNIRYHAVLVPKLGWLTTSYQGCIRAVRARLRELRPDVAHGQGTERDCAICAVFSGVPNVVTIHGNMRLIVRVNRARAFSYEWLSARLERITLPRAGGVVCITSYTRNAVRDFAQRTWLVPNAVDERFFRVQRKPVVPPVILCVGAVSPRKNQVRFIRALDQLASRREFVAVFVGGAGQDEYAAEFRRLVGERSWCRHVGVVSRDELAQQLGAATVLALPSIEDNCPMAVLEAMAAGVPVIGARVGGVPELVQDGITGLLCDPFDAEGMVAAVEKILSDPVRTDEWGVAGRVAAQRRFAPRLIAEQHVQIYRELLSRDS